jgi:hypothetical protein
MSGDTASLILDSRTVSFAKFADAVANFRALIDSLSLQVDPDRGIEWEIEALEKSSAIVAVRGRSQHRDADVQQVITEFEGVARALQSGGPVAGSARTVHAAMELVRLIDAELEEVRLQTPDEDFLIRHATAELLPVPSVLPLHAKPAYGAIEGRIQTMSNRGGVRFTLFDTLNDRAVQCYLYQDQQHLIENMWGRRASVEGLVTRDPATGRPLSIRRITNIEALPEDDANRWRNARGASPSLSHLSPEAAIRKVRDEW